MSDSSSVSVLSSEHQQSAVASTRSADARGALITKTSTTAKEWVHFKVYQYCTTTAHCLLCGKDLKWEKSTTVLTRHLESMHSTKYAELMLAKLEGKKKPAGQTGLESFLSGGLRKDQDEKLLKWVVGIYQPFRAVEEQTFRDLIKSHNSNSTDVSSKKLKTMIKEKVTVVKECVDEMVKQEKGAVTTDGWTSIANQTYFCFTFHWICEDFELHSIPLGIVRHRGTSTAEDHRTALEHEGLKHGLTWENIVALVTDTEPTMNSLGRLVEESAAFLNLYSSCNVLRRSRLLSVLYKMLQLAGGQHILWSSDCYACRTTSVYWRDKQTAISLICTLLSGASCVKLKSC